MNENRRKELIDEIAGTEKLCEYCWWNKEGHVNNSMGMCEGRWCEEAMDSYIDEIEESEI